MGGKAVARSSAKIGDNASGFASPPVDSLLCEARLIDKTVSSFNPQPTAQGDRRSADLFRRCLSPNFRNRQTRNDPSADRNTAALFPLLCEARLNDMKPAD